VINGKATIIAGSRGYGPEWLPLLRYAVTHSPELAPIASVISGTEPTGVDRLGELLAELLGVPVQPFPALWSDVSVPGAVVRYRGDGTPYNAAAGHWRNTRMAEAAVQQGGQALILWNGRSPGSRQMIAQCRWLNVPVSVWLLPATVDGLPTRVGAAPTQQELF